VGTRSCDFKPFYPAAKVTVIGAISLSKVLAVMTLNDSMDPAAFSVFIERCLCRVSASKFVLKNTDYLTHL